MTHEILSGSSTVSSKGQIVIPAALREAAGISEGTLLSMHLHEDGSVVLRQKKNSIYDFIGMGKRHGLKPVKNYKHAIGEYLLAKDERTKSKPKKPK